MRLQQLDNLELDRCPHCSIAKPLLQKTTAFQTTAGPHRPARDWVIYVCRTCGGAVMTGKGIQNSDISEIYPTTQTLSVDIPERARNYLNQAIESIHAPSGAVMLAASAVDAMLKQKGYKAGTLYSRIDEAVDQHLITNEMGAWAHDVRLDANDERHVDEQVELPTPDDAKKCVEFVRALAELLYVLPARVERGRKEATTENAQ